MFGVVLVACSSVHGSRGDYIDVLRPDARPPLVGASTLADSLWGPSGESQRGDGIAESRRVELEELVRRYAPTLVLPNNDYVKVDGRKIRLLPTNVHLFADTLRLDRIRASPYELEDSIDIVLSEISTDSLVSLMAAILRYESDPNLMAAWYFDFPGGNPGQWWEAYGKFRTGSDSALWAQPTVYAHPFLDDDGRTVIQYWYFYPFNDFIGNHEGDWEHVNVVVSADRSRIEEVHYYFHTRSIKLPQGNFEPEIVDGTHPVAYVGGRMYNILDYPIRILTGDRNEGSHGHFPYAGEWEGAGGLSAPESVTKPDKDSTRVIRHNEFRVVLTPEPAGVDYVRVPETLTEWAWLLLPARWGFPAAPSVGSQIKLVDVGNRSPYGLAYNPAFNRTSPGLAYPAYHVRKINTLRSFIEDLLQPWYYLYIFRTPRYVHDTRGTLDRKSLVRLGLAPRGGWRERGIGSTIFGVNVGIPQGDFDDTYDTSVGISLWRNFWAKLRLGAIELMAGYQKFPRGVDPDGSLFVYPITANFVIRAPDALFRPYVSMGGGLYGWEWRVQVPEGAQLVDSGWDLGWTAGVGVEYYLRTRVAFDVALRFHSTEGPGARGDIDDDELRFFSLWFGHFLRF